MILGNMVFEAKIIEKRRLPVVQASHHAAFSLELLFRWNHASPINTSIFDATTPILCAIAALFATGRFHRNSTLMQRAASCGFHISQNGGRGAVYKGMYLIGTKGKQRLDPCPRKHRDR